MSLKAVKIVKVKQSSKKGSPENLTKIQPHQQSWGVGFATALKKEIPVAKC